MENLDQTEETEVVPKKKRLSLFLPSNITTTESSDVYYKDEYKSIMKQEQKNWKEIYSKHKEENKILHRKLETKEQSEVDYKLFTEDELVYLNSGVNLEEFIREAEDFQNILKIYQIGAKICRNNTEKLLDKMEQSSVQIEKQLIKNSLFL